MRSRLLLFSAALPIVAAPFSARAQDSVREAPPTDVVFGDEADGEGTGDLLRPAQMGNLQRVVASLESTLDVYRLALSEVVIVTRLLVAIGEEERARPTRGLPEDAREVFVRLSRVLASRVPADALAPIPRGYHYEALDALEKLAVARELQEITAPLSTFVRSLERIGAVADEVVDLFSRQRPIQVQIFDADTALAQIADAIEAVSEAERRILALRKRGAGLSEQFQAFLFLEISLGNALDLIAAAEEAGINVGFELQLALDGFRDSLERVKYRAVELRAFLDRIEEAPSARAQALEAWRDGSPEIVVRFRQRGGLPAAWRTRVEVDLEAYRAALDIDVRCERMSAEAARAALANAEGLDDTELLLGSDVSESRLPSTPEQLALPLRLTVLPVNAFGVVGESSEVVVDRVPLVAESAPVVQAELASVTPYDPEFYRRFDEVTVRWTSSPNANEPGAAVWVEGAPRVVAYEVFRGEELLTTVGPSVTEWVDRVGLDWLAAGVRYRIVAQTDGAERVSSPECPALDTVRADRRLDLALAASGAGDLMRPTTIEDELATRIEGDAVLREQMREELRALSETDRFALLDRWWDTIEASTRERWWEEWVELQGGEDSQWFQRIEPRIERDRLWVLADMWLDGQEAFIQREVDRYWKLLHPSSRRDVERAWFDRRDDRWRSELEGQLREADDTVRAEILRPARVAAWVASKDPQELSELERWWAELDDPVATTRVWLGKQPRGLVRELRWPGTGALTDDERRARETTAHHELPGSLEPRFFAWWRFERLDGDALRKGIAAEVGPVSVLRSRLRYAVRSFDVATGFNGFVIYILLLLATPVLIVWLRGRRREVRRIIVPPPEAG